ncbi:MAG: hypothetical protein ACRESZ_03975 [Methylococcales bacterium]
MEVGVYDGGVEVEWSCEGAGKKVIESNDYVALSEEGQRKPGSGTSWQWIAEWSVVTRRVRTDFGRTGNGRRGRD